jgi:hypothetical protein
MEAAHSGWEQAVCGAQDRKSMMAVCEKGMTANGKWGPARKRISSQNAAATTGPVGAVKKA